jgi:hypothetical protein
MPRLRGATAAKFREIPAGDENEADAAERTRNGSGDEGVAVESESAEVSEMGERPAVGRLQRRECCRSDNGSRDPHGRDPRSRPARSGSGFRASERTQNDTVSPPLIHLPPIETAGRTPQYFIERVQSSYEANTPIKSPVAAPVRPNRTPAFAAIGRR